MRQNVARQNVAFLMRQNVARQNVAQQNVAFLMRQNVARQNVAYGKMSSTAECRL
jgi:hypothetical protein